MTLTMCDTVRSAKRCALGWGTGVATFGLMLGLLASPGALRASDSPLPDAAAILDKFVEVTGGKAAYEKIHNRVRKERAIHLGMDFEDSTVVYQAAPNKHYVEIESEAFGTIESGSDGNIVWYLSDMTGPIVQQGEAGAAGLHAAAFNHMVRWRELYKNYVPFYRFVEAGAMRGRGDNRR